MLHTGKNETVTFTDEGTGSTSLLYRSIIFIICRAWNQSPWARYQISKKAYIGMTKEYFVKPISQMEAYTTKIWGLRHLDYITQSIFMASHLSTGQALPPAQSVLPSIFTAISYMVTRLMDLGRQGATRAQGHAAAVLAASQVGKNSFGEQPWACCWQRVLTEAQRECQRHNKRSLNQRCRLGTRPPPCPCHGNLCHPPSTARPHGAQPNPVSMRKTQKPFCHWFWCLTLCRPQPNLSLRSQGLLRLHVPSDNKQLAPLRCDSSRHAGERGQNH